MIFGALLGGVSRLAGSGMSKAAQAQATAAQSSTARAARAAQAVAEARQQARDNPAEAPERITRFAESAQADVGVKQRAYDAARRRQVTLAEQRLDMRRGIVPPGMTIPPTSPSAQASVAPVNPVNPAPKRGPNQPATQAQPARGPVPPEMEEAFAKQEKAARQTARGAREALELSKKQATAAANTQKKAGDAAKAAQQQELQRKDAAAKRLAESAAKQRAKAEQAAQASDRQQQATDRLIARAYMAQNLLTQLGSTLSGSFTRGMTAGASAIQGIAGPLKDLVQLSNPASVEAFVRASNDAFAVMGRVARPVLDALTRSMQRMGDFYARIEPILAPVASKLGDTLERMMTRMLASAERNLPAIELMAAVMINVADVAARAAEAVLWLTERIGQLAGIRNLARLLGFDGSKARDGASSKGAAVREVRTVTNAESISRQAIEQAFKQAMNPQAAQGPTEKDIPNLINGIGGVINELLKKIDEFLPKFPTKDDIEQFIKALPELLAKAALNATPVGGAIAAGKQIVNNGGGIGAAVAGISPAGQLVGLLRSAMTR